MFPLDVITAPRLGMTGLDTAMSAEEKSLQDTAHRFARDIMRPIGVSLDRLPAEEVIAPGSRLWDYFAEIKHAGFLDLSGLSAMSVEEQVRILPILFEELGWGDSGLAAAGLISAFPAMLAHATGDAEVIGRFSNTIGCIIATQPDRGSDLIDLSASEVHPHTRQNKGNLVVRRAGRDYKISGQSSAWVSCAPIATGGVVYAPFDDGNGVFDKEGKTTCISLLVPFDEKGVTKGKPLEKLGQRPLPQGEVFFDDVIVPERFLIADESRGRARLFGTMVFANMEMGLIFTGVARAAFDEAMQYVHQRRQGGTELINHQSVRARVFSMWQKLEAARALARRVVAYNFGPLGPHLLASLTSKTFVTQAAMDIANESVQLFGGNGLTKEYPVEKLLRDARMALIEDGENNLLGLMGASWLSQWHREEKGR